MKKKNFITILLSSLIIISGCVKKEESSSSSSSDTSSSSSSLVESSSQKRELPQDAIDFVNAVNSIVFDEQAGIYIDEAFELYEALVDWNYPEVLEAYYKLCLIEELYNDYLNVSNGAQNFIEKVTAIPYFLELSDERYILAAENAYEDLNDEEKKFLGVEEAYKRLLQARAEFDALYQESIEEEKQKIIDEFVDLVNELPSLEEFTVDDYEKVLEALDKYDSLSEEIKEENEVEEAYNKVLALEEKYNELVNITITLDPNGGTCSENSISAKANEAIGTLPTPTRGGYRFLGWYTALEDGDLVSSNSVFKVNTTLYALWKEIVNVTITFDPNGGTCNQTTINTTNEKEIGTLPTPTRDGYRFLGWYTALEDGEKVTSMTIFDQSITLYALWEDKNIIHYVELEGAYLDPYMTNHVRVLWKSSVLTNITPNMNFTAVITYNGQTYNGPVKDWLNNTGTDAAYSGIAVFNDNCPVNFQKDEYSISVSYTYDGTVYTCTVQQKL